MSSISKVSLLFCSCVVGGLRFGMYMAFFTYQVHFFDCHGLIAINCYFTACTFHGILSVWTYARFPYSNARLLRDILDVWNNKFLPPPVLQETSRNCCIITGSFKLLFYNAPMGLRILDLTAYLFPMQTRYLEVWTFRNTYFSSAQEE